MQTPNEPPREITSHLVQGFRRCVVLNGLSCSACGTHLSPTDFVRTIDGSFALRCSGCHHDVIRCEPTENPFAGLR